MRKILSLIPVLFWSLLAAAQQTEITAVIVVTNIPPGLSSNITVNAGTATTRYWTNATAGVESTHIMATNSIGWTKTNLLSHIVAYPIYTVGGGPTLAVSYSTTNTAAINLTAPLGTNITVTFAGNWATVSYFTNTYAQANPILNRTNAMSVINRTNAENSIVNLLAMGRSTNALPLNTKALSNYVDLATSQTFSNKGLTHSVVTGGRLVNTTNVTATNVLATNVTIHIVTITAGTYSGLVSALTNGIWTNGILLSPILTNGANYGLPFRSPGGGSSSEQFGELASASTNFAAVFGYGATAAWAASAFGYLASAAWSNAVAIGSGAEAGAMGATAIGQNTDVQGYQSTGIGNAAATGSTHQRSIAVGAGTSTTASNQVMLGSSTHFIDVPGVVAISGSQSNTTFRGTNKFNGRLDLISRADASLANGNNAAVVLGTNVYVRLSGATTIGAIAGFAAEQDGSFHIVEFSGAVTNLILNQSGVDPTAANRIVTGIAADLALTNSPSTIAVVYDGTASRWKLISFYR